MAKDVIVERQGENIEAQLGIARDEKGNIAWTPEQKAARIAHLNAKIADFANRTKNAKAEIKRLSK